MSTRQLEMLKDWEQKQEEKLALVYQQSLQHLELNKQKLSGLEQYRLDYLRQAQARAQDGLGSTSYNQHQSFIGKLDKACETQRHQVGQASLVCEQRKSQWLQQQKKRKAVTMLIDKKQHAAFLKAEKNEQIQQDELALQKFMRK